MRLRLYQEGRASPDDIWTWCCDNKENDSPTEWPEATRHEISDPYAYYASTRRLMCSLREWCNGN